jgi:hypothetical protein
MVLDEVAWEENDESGKAPYEAEIIVARDGRKNWVSCLVHETGGPYTSHHFLDGC